MKCCRYHVSIIIAIATLLTACTDTASIPTAEPLDSELVGSVEKNGNGGQPGGGEFASETDFQIQVTVDPSGAVTDDGNGPYVGGECSIRSLIRYYSPETNRGGDLVFAPDQEPSRCRRRLTLTIPETPVENLNAPRPPVGSHSIGPYIIINAMMQIAPDYDGDGINNFENFVDAWIKQKYPDSRPRWTLKSNPFTYAATDDITTVPVEMPIVFQMVDLTNCERIRYEGVTVTRLQGEFDFSYGENATPDTDGRWSNPTVIDPITGEKTVDVGRAGRWIIEATPGRHRAVCEYGAKGKTVDGAVYDLPFTMTAAEHQSM